MVGVNPDTFDSIYQALITGASLVKAEIYACHHNVLPDDIVGIVQGFCPNMGMVFLHSDLQSLGLTQIMFGKTWSRVRHDSDSSQSRYLIEIAGEDFEFVKVPQRSAGCSLMRYREPNFSRSFMMMTHPITQKQYKAVMGCNPSFFKDYDDFSCRPVESVSVDEAMLFTARLNTACEQRGFVGDFCLPRESQWEHAANLNITEHILEELECSDNLQAEQTSEVGSGLKGALGLHMFGNVWERTLDDHGDENITCGGSAASCQKGPKARYYRDCRNNFIGFRIIRYCHEDRSASVNQP